MISKIITIGFILVMLIMTSCMVYHPQTVDIPLIEKKNDLRIDAGVSVLPSAQATVSYGLTDKIAIQTFGSFGSDERYYFQGAVGRFKDLGNQKIMEIYSGFGSGYGSAHKDSNPGDLQGDYQLYFMQFNYGKNDCKFAHMDYGFGVKTGLLHSSLTDRNYYYYYYGGYPTEAPYKTYLDNSFLIEPTIFVRLGGERLKFKFQVGSCWLYKFTNTEKSLPYSHLNIGLGLNYRLKN